MKYQHKFDQKKSLFGDISAFKKAMDKSKKVEGGRVYQSKTHKALQDRNKK